MKTSRIVLAAALVLVSALAISAAVKGEGDSVLNSKSGNNDEKGKLQQMFSFDKLDTNHDGVLSREEFQACQPVVRKMGEALSRIRQIVNGGDNKAIGKLKEYALKTYDLNHNGKLDPEEKDVMKKDREELVKKYDSNNDGKLQPEERKELMKEVREKLGITANDKND
ncbi:MAG: hypothetical protein PHW04_13225 [Candidatus Wallbacteria bacterium]|nr:hypothetical protein [Candidatus Wallbacteria bacterium]